MHREDLRRLLNKEKGVPFELTQLLSIIFYCNQTLNCTNPVYFLNTNNKLYFVIPKFR